MTQLLLYGTLNGNTFAVRWICFVTWLFSHYSINYTFVGRLYISFRESVVQYGNHILLMLGVTLLALPSLLVVSLLFHLFNDDHSALLFFILFIAVDLLFSIILTWLFVHKLYQLLRGRILSNSTNRKDPMTALQRRGRELSISSRAQSRSRLPSLKHRTGADIIIKTAERGGTVQASEDSNCTRTRTCSVPSTASTMIKGASLPDLHQVSPSPECPEYSNVLPLSQMHAQPPSARSECELQLSHQLARSSDISQNTEFDVVTNASNFGLLDKDVMMMMSDDVQSDADVDAKDETYVMQSAAALTRVRSDSANTSVDLDTPKRSDEKDEEKDEKKADADAVLGNIDVQLNEEEDSETNLETPVPDTPVPASDAAGANPFAVTRINIKEAVTAVAAQTTMTPVRSTRLFKQIELACISSVAEHHNDHISPNTTGEDEKDMVPELPNLKHRMSAELEESRTTTPSHHRHRSAWGSISQSVSVLMSPQKGQSYKRAKQKLDEQQLYLINSMARQGLLLFLSSLTSLLCGLYILFTYSHFEDMGMDNAEGDIGVEYREAVAYYYLHFCIAVSSFLNAWSLYMSFVFATW
eukprot:CAMPEP_0202705324 /NCGR_PEP_ID=MMETSP1385-20130828/17885_1 /ASSEMBLY_ACC=CAM_ASM_000861 /TAXON_ID=933848 /ORGANISM="Elphidium margaritaceum" /LENGTH=584 /DNA_ID=CAMNT_0049363529 /DNA_START=308 /DNA_END=2059 /DNA_ORIENTATION=-